MLVGIYDPVQPIAAPDTTFTTLVNLRAQIIRLNLDWNLIATRRPAKPTDPADPAYDWSTYDRVLLNADKNKIQVLFTILGTPRWANGKLKGTNRAPAKMADLRYFALAAAKRYSGTFKRDDGVVLPAVRKWLAWNEPNNPVFLEAPVGEGRPALRGGQEAPLRPLRGPLRARSGPRPTSGICTAIWHGHPRLAPRQGSRRLRRDRPARQQRRAEPAPVDLADRVPAGPAQLRPEAQPLRRLRAPPVLQPAERVAGDDAEGQADGHAREHLGADQAARASCTATRSSGSPSTATRPARPTRRSASPGRSRPST